MPDLYATFRIRLRRSAFDDLLDDLGTYEEAVRWYMAEEGAWFPMTDLAADDALPELVSVEEVDDAV